MMRLPRALARLVTVGPAEHIRGLPPTLADALLALLLFGLSLTEIWTSTGGRSSLGVEVRDPDVLAVALLLVICGPLAWRRRAPGPVLAMVGTATVVYTAFNYADTVAATLPILIALYTVAAHATRDVSVVSALVTAVGVAAALFFVGRNHPGMLSTQQVVANYVIFGTAWILGDNVRHRHAVVAQLEERSRLVEQQAERDAADAVVEERARIARELHDVVAHNLGVMTVQAGAGRRVAAKRPEQAAETLGQIEEIGRSALTDMRRMLGVLREEDGPAAEHGREPQPTTAELDRLVDNCREAGLPVDLTVAGEPRALDPGLDLSVYRIVQEALTNTLKHGGRARAQVGVHYRDDGIEVDVLDDGRGAATALAATGAGHGLIGMRERVELFGGTLQVGPRPGGGYRVHAQLPYQRRRGGTRTDASRKP